MQPVQSLCPRKYIGKTQAAVVHFTYLRTSAICPAPGQISPYTPFPRLAVRNFKRNCLFASSPARAKALQVGSCCRWLELKGLKFPSEMGKVPHSGEKEASRRHGWKCAGSGYRAAELVRDVSMADNKILWQCRA